MTPEAKVKRDIDKLLKGFKVWYFCPVSYGMGKHGIHDRICCVPVTITKKMVGKKVGLFLSVEAKAGKGKPTKLQLQQAKAVVEAHGLTALVNENRLYIFQLFLETLTGRTYDKSRSSSKKKSASRRRRSR